MDVKHQPDHGEGYVVGADCQEEESAEFYCAELNALRRRWNEILMLEGLSVLEEPHRPGYPYILPTTQTPRKPRCYHRPLQDAVWGALEMAQCSHCEQRLSGSAVGHVEAGKIFGRGRVPRSAKKRTPTERDDSISHNGLQEHRPRPKETDGEFIAKVENMWASLGKAAPVPVVERGWHWKDIQAATSAPEIEHRAQRAALRFERPTITRRYRASHAKVQDLRRAGLTQVQIAKRLRVSERTIRSRVGELPPSPPKEITSADLLSRRVRAGGGWMRQAFWPGGKGSPWSDHGVPRGSSESRPDVCTAPSAGYFKKGLYEQRRLSGS
jgi:hypothetical protein